MAELQLVGSAHIEPKPERALRMLDRECPDVLAVELAEGDLDRLYSEYERLHRGEMTERERLLFTDQGIQLYRFLMWKQIVEGLIKPINYASKHQIPIAYIDDPKLSVHRNNVQAIIPECEAWWSTICNQQSWEEIAAAIECLYDCIRAAHKSENALTEGTLIDTQGKRPAFANNRDEATVQNLLSLMERVHGKILYYCGLFHTLDDYKQETVYAKLKSRGIIVSRATLKDFDESE